MDIVTAPYQPAPSHRGRLLIGAGVFAPVALLTMLPVGLGLQRFVATTDEMAPAIQRGALVLERDVPVGDLEIGDVITFVPPAASGIEGPVTRRIVEIDGRHLHTKADAQPRGRPVAGPAGRSHPGPRRGAGAVGRLRLRRPGSPEPRGRPSPRAWSRWP